jgi:hypothetical protein
MLPLWGIAWTDVQNRQGRSAETPRDPASSDALDVERNHPTRAENETMMPPNPTPELQPLPPTLPVSPALQAVAYGQANQDSWFVANVKNGALLEIGAVVLGLAAAILRLRNRSRRR